MIQKQIDQGRQDLEFIERTRKPIKRKKYCGNSFLNGDFINETNVEAK
jgi:hypothetical protein